MSLERLFDADPDPPDPAGLYERVVFPDPTEDRPYVFCNMAATADGKIVVGEPGGTAKGVGGPTDQVLFRRLQRACDGAMIGAATLRASHVLYPPEILRFVVTRGGNVPLQNRFFTDAPGRAYVIAPEDLPDEEARKIRAGANLLPFGQGGADLAAAMAHLRRELGISRLLCEGGAELNAQLLNLGLLDELFLTLAPKLKGGAHLPTIVSGNGFPPGQSLPLALVSLYRDGSEIYLRYRLEPPPRPARTG